MKPFWVGWQSHRRFYGSLEREEQHDEDWNEHQGKKVTLRIPGASVYGWFLWTLLIIDILILLVLFAYSKYRFNFGCDEKSELRFYPRIKLNSISFEPDERYSDISFTSTDADPWKHLIPEGGGFILVQDPKSMHLSGGLPISVNSIPLGEVFGVSMFHQIHCLEMMQKEMAFLAFAESKMAVPQHIKHCFDYLRQAIMCAGDLSLENGTLVNGSIIPHVGGWGAQHQCRDWQTVFDFTASHRPPSDSRFS